MYAFFKKFKQFFIGLGTAIVGIIAYIFYDRNRNSGVESDFDELKQSHNEALENISNAERLVRQLSDSNRQLRQDLEDGTTELRFDVEEIRLENSRLQRELANKIASTRQTIQHIKVGADSSKTELNKIKQASRELAGFIQRYGKGNPDIEDIDNSSSSINSIHSD